MYRIFAILIVLCLSSLAVKTIASPNNAVPLVKDIEDIVIISSKTEAKAQNLSIDARIDVREIEKLNARKRAQRKSLDTNYIDPELRREGGPSFILLPGATSPPEDLRHPNITGTRHEKMINGTSSVISTGASGSRWATKNFRK